MSDSQKHTYSSPNKEEAQLAAASSRILAACHGSGDTAKLRLIDDNKDVTVPVKAIHMLADILEQMAAGNAISIVPVHAELTTQQAADFLNVSRPYLISNILDAGTLPFHMAGNRRKLYFKDVMAYKENQQQRSKRAMQALADLSQDLDLMD
jgi:excisionase family DNA binding protein